MSSLERRKELNRRRHRQAKVTRLKKRVEKATASEKGVIAEKLRRLTPGGETVIAQLGLEEKK